MAPACLALPHGIPSHDTFGRVFARLHPQRFQERFLAWTQAVAQLTQGTLISLDGKTVKASFDRATASSPLHLLSAWCSENGGLVLGQIKTGTKSNEITAIPALLQLLALKGCIVTIIIRQVKYLNNMVEQDHRGVKRITRPMLEGFKAFDAVQSTLVGIELMHMLRKGQLVGGVKQEVTAAEQFYALAS